MSPRPHRTISKLLTGAERLLWIVGLCLLGWVGYVELDTYAYRLHAADALHAERVDAVSRATPGTASDGAARQQEPAPVLAIGDPVGKIEIPRIGLSAVVAEGASNAVLRHAVGHLPDTPLPGFGGNAAIAGHRDRQFRPLRDVAPGDEILVTTPERTLTYRVEWTRVTDPSDLDVLAPTPTPTLTLITCHPFQYIGHAPDRFIVRARQITDSSTALPAG
jgi:sortase A